MVAYNAVVEQAQESISQGNVPEAIMHYMNAQTIMPTAGIWHEIGLLQLSQGNEFPAMSAFQSAIVEDPNHAPSLEYAGLLYLDWKQSRRAGIALSRAVEADPSLWRSHNGLGIVADMAGDFPAAQKHYASALELEPSSPDILNNIGYSHFLSGNNDRAQQALDDAIKQNREHKIAWNNLALVFARQGRYGDAYNILASNHNKAIAYHDVGYIALLNADYVFADEYLSKAINASPTYFEEAFHNRAAARNRMIGNREGSFVTRRETEYPYCIALGAKSC
jgi:Flp pilus assembly protein TadD